MGNSNIAVTDKMDPNNVDVSDWVVVNSPGGRYMGRIAGDLNPGNDGSGAADLSQEKPTDQHVEELRKKVLEAVSNGDIIELSPALDFLAPLRPIPQPNGQLAMTRDPIIVPVDFAMHEIPVFVKASSLYFLADMKPKDKSTYKELVASGLRAALSARAASVGLVAPNGPVPGKVSPLRG